MKYLLSMLLGLCFLATTATVRAQLSPNVYTYITEEDTLQVTHQFAIDDSYFVYSAYTSSPNTFITTMGGYYTAKKDTITVNLEFNANYKEDQIKTLQIPYTIAKEQLIVDFKGIKALTTPATNKQALDGKWLMAGRVVNGEERSRDTTRPRKTMKFLLNGHFQWIAFNTETFQFSGTGGGVFSAKDGVYEEHILFFSRDHSRVGAKLKFSYDIKESNWHHTGKSSKGAPLYEIWTKRN